MVLVKTDPSFCFILQSHICKSKSLRSPLPLLCPFRRWFCSKVEAAWMRRGTALGPWAAKVTSGGCALLTPRHLHAPLGPAGTGGRAVLCGVGPSRESQNYDLVMCQLKCP